MSDFRSTPCSTGTGWTEFINYVRTFARTRDEDSASGGNLKGPIDNWLIL